MISWECNSVFNIYYKKRLEKYYFTIVVIKSLSLPKMDTSYKINFFFNFLRASIKIKIDRYSVAKLHQAWEETTLTPRDTTYADPTCCLVSCLFFLCVSRNSETAPHPTNTYYLLNLLQQTNRVLKDNYMLNRKI